MISVSSRKPRISPCISLFSQLHDRNQFLVIMKEGLVSLLSRLETHNLHRDQIIYQTFHTGNISSLNTVLPKSCTSYCQVGICVSSLLNCDIWYLEPMKNTSSYESLTLEEI